MTYLVIVAFVAILGSLAAALVFMMRGGPASDDPAQAPRKNPMARALAFRVGFSVLLFLLVLLSYWMGWIQPTGLPLVCFVLCLLKSEPWRLVRQTCNPLEP